MAKYQFETTGAEVAADCAVSIKDKVVLITGVSPSGLGAAFALTIAKHAPRLLILAGRSISNAEKTAADIAAVAPSVSTRILKLDLSSQRQVREAAREVNDYQEQIDVLMNNSGIMAVPFELTEDGIESQFGTNHIGHFLFTNLILNKLASSADGKQAARIVNVSSSGYRLSPIRFEDWNFNDGKTYNPWIAYGQSKTANMLFSKSLASRIGNKGIISLSVHPGAIMQTNLARSLSEIDFGGLRDMDLQQGHRKFWDGFNFKTLEQGVATHVFASFHDSISLKDHNGAYLEDSRVLLPEEISCWGRDEVEAEKLWKLSEEIVGEKFEY